MAKKTSAIKYRWANAKQKNLVCAIASAVLACVDMAVLAVCCSSYGYEKAGEQVIDYIDATETKSEPTE